jgi:hypothetical protein
MFIRVFVSSFYSTKLIQDFFLLLGTGENYRDIRPIDVFVLNTNTFRWKQIPKPAGTLRLYIA